LAGRFIVIDGPDGAGKSTQVRLLAERLAAAGLDVRAVRDPGGTAIGDKIREILLDGRHGSMCVACELMLYMASRAQLAVEVIRPALSAGRCVLCDRFLSATVAYQGAGGADVEQIRQVARAAVGDLQSDLTIILDLPAEVGLARAAARQDRASAPDRMEAKDLTFHRRVRELFLDQAGGDPARFAVVDGRGDIDEVHRRLLDLLAAWRFPRPDA
jgi:dTMP kinase